MKCQKCAKPAIVHLTEIVSETVATPEGSHAQVKRAVEIHLCLGHAVEAGLMVPTPQLPIPLPEVTTVAKKTPVKEKKAKTTASGGSGNESRDGSAPMAIVPASPQSAEIVPVKPKANDPSTCSVCGAKWEQFKKTGLMGCPHDYETFGLKALPLIKRAHEGATHHVGKVPVKCRTIDTDRHSLVLRLRRELQKSVEMEHYEEAVKLRDRLRQLEQHG